MSNRENGLSFYKRKKKISAKQVHEVIYWIISVLIVIFVACALVYFYGMRTKVVGLSMEPGLVSEQEVLVDRFRYVLLKPSAGDVVIFLPNGNINSHYYTKRVVATPGDKVLIENGILYVNGEPSPYVTERISDPGIAVTEFQLSSGEYFVLGDVPSDSEDSRSSAIGPVDSTDIVGKVWFKLPGGEGKIGFVK